MDEQQTIQGYPLPHRSRPYSWEIVREWTTTAWGRGAANPKMNKKEGGVKQMGVVGQVFKILGLSLEEDVEESVSIVEEEDQPEDPFGRIEYKPPERLIYSLEDPERPQCSRPTCARTSRLFRVGAGDGVLICDHCLFTETTLEKVLRDHRLIQRYPVYFLQFENGKIVDFLWDKSEKTLNAYWKACQAREKPMQLMGTDGGQLHVDPHQVLYIRKPKNWFYDRSEIDGWED
jgi:hypothetical protein